MIPPLARKLIAEFLGVTVFVAGIVGIVHNNAALAGLAIPATLGLMIVLFGSVSGAHLNPAVTLYFLAHKDISLNDGIGYIIAQVLGGVVGAWLGGLYFGVSELTTRAGDIGPGQFVGEVVATGGLVWLVGHLAANKMGNWIAPALVFWLLAAGSFTSSGAVANPAVTVGLMLKSGLGTNQGMIFILAQAIGVVVALLGVTYITNPAKAAKAKAKKK